MEDDRRHYSPKISCHSQIVNPVGQELKEWLGTETLGLWGTCGKGREVRGSQEACTEGFGQPSFKMQRWSVIVLGAILWAFQFWILLFSSVHTLRCLNIEYTMSKRLSRDKGGGQLETTYCGFPKNQNSVKVNSMYSTLTMWQLIHILVVQKRQIRLLSGGKLWTRKRLNWYTVTVIRLTLKKVVMCPKYAWRALKQQRNSLLSAGVSAGALWRRNLWDWVVGLWMVRDRRIVPLTSLHPMISWDGMESIHLDYIVNLCVW